MSYQLYRNTTLGNSLQESLDELIQGVSAFCFGDKYSQVIESTRLLKDLFDQSVTDIILDKSQQISPQLALQVLLQFDKAINYALSNKVKSKISFKGHLNTYRFCDNVWTFVLNNVEFREVGELVKVEKVKVVACDGKASAADAGGT